MDFITVLKEVMNNGLAIFISVFFIMKLLPQLIDQRSKLSDLQLKMERLINEVEDIKDCMKHIPKRSTNGISTVTVEKKVDAS